MVERITVCTVVTGGSVSLVAPSVGSERERTCRSVTEVSRTEARNSRGHDKKREGVRDGVETGIRKENLEDHIGDTRLTKRENTWFEKDWRPERKGV